MEMILKSKRMEEFYWDLIAKSSLFKKNVSSDAKRNLRNSKIMLITRIEIMIRTIQ
jgi:hypothetical protein